jgi:hypothetical protein
VWSQRRVASDSVRLRILARRHVARFGDFAGMLPEAIDKSASSEVSECYRTAGGVMLQGRIEDALETNALLDMRSKVNLILTSPPFPLIKKKNYGNETGERYLDWLSSLAPRLANLITDDGSIVIEIGNAWTPGVPFMSTLPLEALLAFKRAAGLHLCQHVICHNTARLPSPAQWVTVRRIRLNEDLAGRRVP